jgi:hypothetical protein
VVPDLALQLVGPGREPRPDLVEHVTVQRDAGVLHRGEDRHQRQLDLGQQGCLAPLGQLVGEVLGKLEGRLGPVGTLLPRVVVHVEAELVAGVGLLRRDRPLQVLQGDAVEVEAALLGVAQVGRELGVDRQPGDVPTAVTGDVDQGLGLVRDDRDIRVGEDAGERIEVAGGRVGHPQGHRVAVGGCERDRLEAQVRDTVGGGDDDRDRTGRPVEPGAERATLEPLRGAFELLRLLLLDLTEDVGHEAVVQRAELERPEQRPHRVGVEGPHPQVGDVGIDLDVVAQRHHRRVDPHLWLVLEQHRRDLLAPDPVDVRVDPVDVTELGDELRGGLLPHARHPREVVGGVPPQGRVLHVLLRGDAVLLPHGRGGHLPHVGDAADVVEDGHVLARELHRITVPGDHEHVEAGLDRPVRQRRDDVVGLHAGDDHDRDVEDLEHLLDEVDLRAERVRGRAAVRLVLRVRGSAGLVATLVERDDDVVGPSVREQLDEHRREAVDGVGLLSGLGPQVLGQRVEGAVGQRVAVEQQEGRAVGHRARPRRRG